jgi:hypothetical protein
MPPRDRRTRGEKPSTAIPQCDRSTQTVGWPCTSCSRWPPIAAFASLAAPGSIPARRLRPPCRCVNVTAGPEETALGDRAPSQ